MGEEEEWGNELKYCTLHAYMEMSQGNPLYNSHRKKMVVA
jgi:hypothetical protein